MEYEAAMRSVTLNDRVKIPEDILYHPIGDEMVLLNMERGFYYGLNPVGRRVWELLAEKQRLQAVFEIMLVEYDTTGGVLQRDILRLVRELTAKGLVEIVSR